MASLSQQRREMQVELEQMVMQIFWQKPDESRRSNLVFGLVRTLAVRMSANEIRAYCAVLRRDNP